MKQFSAILLITALLIACGPSQKSQSSTSGGSGAKVRANYQLLNETTFQLTGISEDATYGFSEKNAIKVGDPGADRGGPLNERRFLNALLGPNGESIMYTRKGACCQVKSDNGFMGYAMLDMYELMYEGLENPIVLYINMYDPSSDLKAPKGFTFKK